LSDVKFTVDGKKITVSLHFSYKGMMLSDVLNMVQTFGYINASWTLRADLTSEYVCRLINQMDKLGMRQVSAPLSEADKGMQARKYIEDFTPGYMMRTAHLMPRQGDRELWLNTQNYTQDKKMIRNAPLEDGVLKFDKPHSAVTKVSAA
jgi:monooxygenase